MIESVAFTNFVRERFTLVSGVPDSLLKYPIACFSELLDSAHKPCTNEGSALALAMGHFLASNTPALVYLQNSGLGNIVNPLLSLAHTSVYGIPSVCLIGWRGEIQADGTQISDEPQHRAQGRLTPDLLKILEVPFAILDSDTQDWENIFDELINTSISKQTPVALLVKSGTFTPFQLKDTCDIHSSDPTRQEIISQVLGCLPKHARVFSTTGMASREVFEHRFYRSEPLNNDFLTVGGMGHASSIAAGYALQSPDTPIVCIDGDGASLMHLGAYSFTSQCKNFIHILVNNFSHDSVGGQPTLANRVHFTKIAESMGYDFCLKIDDYHDLPQIIEKSLNTSGSTFLEITARKGAKKDLMRPTTTPLDNKRSFMATSP